MKDLLIKKERLKDLVNLFIKMALSMLESFKTESLMDLVIMSIFMGPFTEEM